MKYTQEQVDVLNAERETRLEIIGNLEALYDNYVMGDISAESVAEYLKLFIDEQKYLIS